MTRLLLVLALVAAIFGGVYASAANLTVQGGSVQAGSDNTLSCAQSGVQVVAWATNTIAGSYEGLDWVTVHLTPADAVRCAGNDLVGRVDLGGSVVSYLGAYWSGFGPIPANPSWVRIKADTTDYMMSFYPDQNFNAKDFVDPQKVQSIKFWLGGPANVND